jgi:hypothetical protein
MKRFFVTVLSVSVFFLGLGAMIEKAGAKFKSDEKALELVRQARKALGGDAAIAGVQSLRIVGKTSRNIKADGIDHSMVGETEIALQFPDKLSRTEKIGDGTGEKIHQSVDVIVTGDHSLPMKKEFKVTTDGTGNGKNIEHVIIRKADGTTEEIDRTAAAGEHSRVMLRKMEAGQEGHVVMLHPTKDGATGDKIVVRDVVRDGAKTEFKVVDGQNVIIDKDVVVHPAGDHAMMMKRAGEGPEHRAIAMSHAGGAPRQNEMLRLTLALLMTPPQGMDVNYTFGGEANVDGTACNIVVAEFGGSSYKIYLGQSSNLPVQMTYSGGAPTRVFFSKGAPTPPTAPAAGMPERVEINKIVGTPHETAETTVKFSDYRTVNGVQLPYKWSQSSGAATEVFDVTSYEVNPANISEKFKEQRTFVKTAKPATK